MRNLSIGLVTVLLAQSLLAGGIDFAPAAAPVALLGKITSDLMWVAAKGKSTPAGRHSGQSAKKAEGPGSPKSNNNALNSGHGGQSAGSGGGNDNGGHGGQPPRNPNNGVAAASASSSTLVQLIERMRDLLRQMHLHSNNENVLADLLADAEGVFAQYENHWMVRYFGSLGNGRAEMRRLIEEARQIREAARPRVEMYHPMGDVQPEMSVPRGEGRVTGLLRRMNQAEEQVHETRIIAESAAAAARLARIPAQQQQQQQINDDLLPELDNNGEDI